MKRHKDLYRRMRRLRRQRLAVAKTTMDILWERLAERGVPEQQGLINGLLSQTLDARYHDRRPVEGPWL